MTKYKELVEDYQGAIEEIKENQEKLTRLQAEITELEAIWECSEHADYEPIAEMVEEAGELSERIAEDRVCLDCAVKREYERVPYGRARNQGIGGFYRLAGLEPW